MSTISLTLPGSRTDGEICPGERAVPLPHGLSLDAAIGKKDQEVFPRDLADIYSRNDEEAISTGAGTEFAEPVRTVDGRKSMIETTRTPLYDDAQELLGIAGVARAARIEDEGTPPDAAEAVKAEEALKQAEEDTGTSMRTPSKAYSVRRPMAA